MGGCPVSLEEALQEHEERVDVLLKSAGRYVSALKAWKKACQTGHMSNRQKAAATAVELAPALAGPTAEAAEAWQFDVRAYLESREWRAELQTTVALERFGLRVLEEGDTLISSPVVVRSQPGKSWLAIGKVNWPAIRPKVVAAELKRLRERTAAANSQELVDSLFLACQRLNKEKLLADSHLFAKFRDIYDLFCLTPGWKKENPWAAFGQAIYALHRSEIRATRGRTFEIEYSSGKAKEKDILTVIAEDGRPLRYYGIWFR
jgi:hypothetical protein